MNRPYLIIGMTARPCSAGARRARSNGLRRMYVRRLGAARVDGLGSASGEIRGRPPLRHLARARAQRADRRVAGGGGASSSSSSSAGRPAGPWTEVGTARPPAPESRAPTRHGFTPGSASMPPARRAWRGSRRPTPSPAARRFVRTFERGAWGTSPITALTAPPRRTYGGHDHGHEHGAEPRHARVAERAAELLSLDRHDAEPAGDVLLGSRTIAALPVNGPACNNRVAASARGRARHVPRAGGGREANASPSGTRATTRGLGGHDRRALPPGPDAGGPSGCPPGAPPAGRGHHQHHPQRRARRGQPLRRAVLSLECGTPDVLLGSRS